MKKISLRHLVLGVLVGLFCCCTTGRAVQAQEVELRPEPAVEFIINSYETNRIVALGEVHELEAYFDFVITLIQTPAFQMQVDDIVIEFGNALYQDVLDRYIFGEEVAEEEIKKVWQNHTESPTGPWHSPVYSNLLERVREVNLELPEGRKFRVVAADPPIDWAKVSTREDYNAFRGRTAHIAKTTLEEVLDKGRKGIIVCGGAHLSRVLTSPSGRVRKSVTNRIEEKYPESVFVVHTVAGFGKKSAEVEAHMAPWPIPSIAMIKGTWIGALSPPSIINTNTGQAVARQQVNRREDLVDAYLYLGGFSTLNMIHASPTDFEDDKYWEELNRRSVIRYGRPLDPESRKRGAPRPVRGE